MTENLRLEKCEWGGLAHDGHTHWRWRVHVIVDHRHVVSDIAGYVGDVVGDIVDVVSHVVSHVVDVVGDVVGVWCLLSTGRERERERERARERERKGRKMITI